MKLFDSNVWIAHTRPSDSLYKKAVAQFAALKHDEMVALPEYVIAEASSVLLIREGRQAANAFIENVLDNERFEIIYSTRQSFIDTVQLFTKQTKKLSFVDSHLLALSDQYEIITFDKDLASCLKKQGRMHNICIS